MTWWELLSWTPLFGIAGFIFGHTNVPGTPTNEQEALGTIPWIIGTIIVLIVVVIFIYWFFFVRGK